MVDPGDIVHASDSSAIATRTSSKPSAVLITLSARALNGVRDAMARGPVEVTALSQDNRRTLGKGALLLIDNMVDQAGATMRLKAMFANEDEQLWPGDFVNSRVSLEVRPDALTIPAAAIQREPDAVGEGDVVQARPITSGPTTRDRTMITLGLTKRERVVVNGQHRLRQKSKVTFTVPPIPAVAKQARAS
jgi:membrane fusion protein, multidrug efflux system